MVFLFSMSLRSPFLKDINTKCSSILSNCSLVRQDKKSATMLRIFSSVKEYPKNTIGDSENRVSILAITSFLESVNSL